MDPPTLERPGAALSCRQLKRQRQRDRLGRESYAALRSASRKRRRHRQRNQVFAHYGRSCACCRAREGLTIDHVHGNGAEQRAELGPKGVGVHFYHWLVVNGFPPGYQTLCGPCNQSKGRGPACRLDHTEKQDRRDVDTAGRSLIAC